MKMISFVIACYNCEKSIATVANEVAESVLNDGRFGFELIMVDDFSSDDTRSEIRELCENDERMRGVYLSRNFGQPGAILAGFSTANGDLVAYCDDDGQCPVDKLPEFLDKIAAGSDVVWAKYRMRKAGLVSRIGTKLNSLMVRLLIGKPQGVTISNFFVARRFVVDEVLLCKSPSPYIGGLMLSATSRMDTVDVTQRKRIHGRSSYSVRRLMHLWLNGVTGFSVVPLRIASIMGFVTATGGFIYSIVIVAMKILNPEMPLGYSSIMAVMLFMFGSVLLLMGLMGEYIGRLYLNSNSIPQFVIREVSVKPNK